MSSSRTNVTLRITVTPQNVTLDVDAHAGPDTNAHAGPDAYVQADETKEAPVLLTARADEKEATPSVYPPHLDGLRTHGDNWEGQPLNVGLIVAIDKMQWSTCAWVAVIVLCALYCGLVYAISLIGSGEFLLCMPMILACVLAVCCAVEGIYINRGYLPRPGALPVRRSKLLQLRRRRQQLLVLRAVLLVRVRREVLHRRAARGGREGLQGLLLRRLGRICSDLQADRRAAADVQTDDPEKIEKRSIPSPESLPKVN